MDSNLEELLSNDIVKNEIVDSEEEQIRLAAGKDKKWPVNEEADNSPLIKEEVDDGEMWRYGGSSTKKKLDCGENPEPKRRKVISAMEASSYVIQQGLNAEVEEEAGPFIPAAPESVQAGSLPFAKIESDNQVFNAHDLFTNEAIVKEELKEDEEEQEGQDWVESMDETAYDGNDTEKQEEMWKVCPVDGCSEKFSSEETLQKHMRIHPKPIICGVCQRPCPHAAELRRHYVVHSGEKPFQCEYCEKMFTEAGTLKKHACSACDYRCFSSSRLARHMRTHTGEKLFECTDCDQCFSRREHLERHKAAVHFGIRKYSCPECDHKSARQTNLSRHIKAMHKK